MDNKNLNDLDKALDEAALKTVRMFEKMEDFANRLAQLGRDLSNVLEKFDNREH